MKTFQLRYSKKALGNLKKLQPKTARRILEKLDFFIQQKDPLGFAKKLTNPLYGTYRFRIGDYRVIFDTDKEGNIEILMVLAIKHRKEVYRDL
ncbi:MAG: addiction module antitoxin [uncultured bacterium]|nr:MAG: addiction module antitoxin [uncultured bacterium]KKT77208.1 MAG: Addiction module toxin, RelE/StbE family [Candidatus Peregrinibacteria bacterium GW2011_GWA2_44_7]